MWKLKCKGRNRGFTLIEILVTIGIIAVLAGIGVVTIGKVRGANSQTTCISNLRMVILTMATICTLFLPNLQTI